MQTTLLGLAIAFILALATALVGPFFVDWTAHRAQFETQASRLIGVPVRVTGPIDVRLLPAPTVTLGGLEIGADSGSSVKAQSLHAEIELGSLLRGAIRSGDMRIVAPDIRLGLDRQGRIEWPVALRDGGDALAIDRLRIEDGRAVLTDAASGSRLELDRLWFNGDVRSLVGPVRGEGGFTASGGVYGYRVAVGRPAEDGTRLRLSFESADHARAVETEGALAFDAAGLPRYDGTLTMLRPAAAGGEGWRLTSRIKAQPASALFEQVEFQYGPDERAVKLAGTAELKLGATPTLQGALSTRQVDLDRLIGAGDAPRRLPFAAIQAFSEMFGGALKPVVPVNLAVSVDAVTLGGALLQGVGADLRSEAGDWQLDKLEFRAPGFTQVRLSGRLEMGRALGFAGAASVESTDPKTLMSWLAGQPTTPAALKRWQARGEIALGPERIAVERLRTEFDRGSLEGRLSYAFAAEGRPARLDADLRAGEIDLDALMAFGESAFAGIGLERPREIALAFEAGRARIAGFEAQKAQARVRLDGTGIAIERLSVADFGNATIEARGRIETSGTPGGNITVDLDARQMGGVIALAERFAPALAEPLRQVASRQRTAKLRAGLSLERSGADRALGRLTLSGRLGALQVDGQATASGKPEAFVPSDLGAMASTELRLEAKLSSDDGAAVLGLVGLERAATADKRGARLSVVAEGPASGAMRLEARLDGGLIDAGASGRATLFGDGPATLELDKLSGTIAGTRTDGALKVTLGDAARVDGALTLASVDAPALIAAAIGLRQSRGPAWSQEPLARSLANLDGRIELRAPRLAIAPTLAARDLRATVRLGPSQITFDDVAADIIGGGRLDGRLAFAAGPDGVTARTRLALRGVDAASVLPRTGLSPAIAGTLSVEAEIDGAGLTPAALVGSLNGAGSLILADARLAGLSPRAFDAVIRAADLGVAIEPARIRDFVTVALDNGTLALPRAETQLGIAGGQVRIANLVATTPAVELALSASLNLMEASLDATLSLLGPAQAKDPLRPVVFVSLKGPVQLPRRTVDANALTGWLALRAVEQQSKKLEAIEKERERALRERPAEPPAPAAPQAPPKDAAVDPAPPPPLAAPASPPDARAGDPAPALPPAVLVQPAPRPRAVAPAARIEAPAQPQPPRPAARAPLNILDLLGAQN